MKQFLSMLLLSLGLFAGRAFAFTPYDMILQQVNAAGNDYGPLQFLELNGNQLWGYDISTETPKAITIGTGLSLNTSTWTLTATAAPARSFVFNPSRTIQTVAAAANGWQIDASRDSDVSYSITTNTTATIGGASTATVVLEVAATNSSTAGDWTEVGRVANSQTITLAIVLQSLQSVAGTVHTMVPAGYFCRLRSTLTGTSSATFNSGSEIKL